MKVTISTFLLALCMFSLVTPYMETRANFFGVLSPQVQPHVLIEDIKARGIFTEDTAIALCMFVACILPFLRYSKKKGIAVLYLLTSCLFGYVCFLLNVGFRFQIFSTIEHVFAAFWTSQLLLLFASLYLLYLAGASWILGRNTPPDHKTPLTIPETSTLFV